MKLSLWLNRPYLLILRYKFTRVAVNTFLIRRHDLYIRHPWFPYSPHLKNILMNIFTVTGKLWLNNVSYFMNYLNVISRERHNNVIVITGWHNRLIRKLLKNEWIFDAITIRELSTLVCQREWRSTFVALDTLNSKGRCKGLPVLSTMILLYYR